MIVTTQEYVDGNPVGSQTIVVDPDSMTVAVDNQDVVIVTNGVQSVVTVGDNNTDVEATQLVVVINEGLQGPRGFPGAGGNPYTNSTPVPVGLGGIHAGETFDAVDLDDMFTKLLYPYQTPVGSLSMAGVSSPQEVGYSHSGPATFTWSFSNPSNMVAGSVSIKDPNGTTIASGLNASGSQSIEADFSESTVTSLSWHVQGTDTNGDTITGTLTISWLFKVFDGISTNPALDASGVQALGGQLQSGGAGTYSYAGGGYKYLAVPAAYSQPTSFTDVSTNLDVAMAAPYSVSITNSHGVTESYTIYRTEFILGGAITIRVA